MKTNKHNIFWTLLLVTTLVFGQKQEKKISESFKVNSDAVVDISVSHTDLTIETWNKNEVSVEGVWEIEGVSKEEANECFDDWGFEALGNSNKVVIKSDSHHNFPHGLFDDHDFDFDFDHNFNFNFDSISFPENLFGENFYFEMPEIPMAPIFPEPFMAHLSKIQFDYEAYQKDKEGYMKEFEKRQEEWQKEFEEKIEPQMKKFEEKMKKWEKDNEPKMREYEEKMKKWEKENEKKLEELEERAEKMEKELHEKYEAKLEKRNKLLKDKKKSKKKLVIKIPKTAKVKLDASHGTISLPDDINTID